jgi:hypothetical protein
MNQTTDTILMVRPAHFGYNEQTAESNAFQKRDDRLSPQEISERARREFDGFVARLREAGVQVIVVEDEEQVALPDAVFPNNWVTFHENGAVVTYPMYADLRRLERRQDVIEGLTETFGFRELIHLEQYEKENRYLEGTGSMILDRQNRIAYACLSPRTDRGVLEDFCRRLGYTPMVFTAVDDTGRQIYHTNVLMALGETFVVICLDTVRDREERTRLIELFGETNKEAIRITMAQMMAFAGNMLQVRNTAGDMFLVMSEQAYRSLSDEQIRRIRAHTDILSSQLTTIETYGGGSARCMMAEVFKPGR